MRWSSPSRPGSGSRTSLDRRDDLLPPRLGVAEREQQNLARCVIEGDGAVRAKPGRDGVAALPLDRDAHRLGAQLVAEPAHPAEPEPRRRGGRVGVGADRAQEGEHPVREVRDEFGGGTEVAVAARGERPGVEPEGGIRVPAQRGVRDRRVDPAAQRHDVDPVAHTLNPMSVATIHRWHDGALEPLDVLRHDARERRGRRLLARQRRQDPGPGPPPAALHGLDPAPPRPPDRPRGVLGLGDRPHPARRRLVPPRRTAVAARHAAARAPAAQRPRTAALRGARDLARRGPAAGADREGSRPRTAEPGSHLRATPGRG